MWRNRDPIKSRSSGTESRSSSLVGSHVLAPIAVTGYWYSRPGWLIWQMRNNHRQFIGYVGPNSAMTNTHRQLVADCLNLWCIFAIIREGTT